MALTSRSAHVLHLTDLVDSVSHHNMFTRLLMTALLWVAIGPKNSFAQTTDDPWQATLDKVVPAVVSLRVAGTRGFDTGGGRSSTGTGFIVDAERGLILTNRHMVQPGPVVADAIFSNHEEVPLQAIYRDPVHDFGFYRFNPDDLQFMEVSELSLAPEAAQVGLDIRVVGNDAGEKISILDGTLARVDRKAPNYGGNRYNDFNTFYIQAASNTSGGSSGSPVIDRQGRVVALNAGGSRKAASSFYLPLDRVVRALEHLQRDEPIARGTLQTTFGYTPYEKLRRLGLDIDTESKMRALFPDREGLLVVESVVPGGPGAEGLKPGDIVLAAEGSAISDFVRLEEIVDGSVGQSLTLELWRGSQTLTQELSVGDLHAISPSEYVEIGLAVVHPLSYQQARNHTIPVQGLYLASAGHLFGKAGIPRGAILTAIDDQPLASLDELVALLAEIPHQARMKIRYHTTRDPRHEFVGIATMNHVWLPAKRCRLQAETGAWPCQELALTNKKVAPPTGTSLPVVPKDKIGRRLSRSLVQVSFDIPFPTSGVKDQEYVGTGVIVDVQRGLVLVDRDTLPIALGDLSLTFFGTLRVPARVLFLHPIHDFGVIQYDPQALSGVELEAVEFLDRPVKQGEALWMVGLRRSHQIVTQKTRVKTLDALRLGTSRTPKFRDANIDAIHIADRLPTTGGVLCDRKGRALALWASFMDPGSSDRSFYGLPVQILQPVLKALERGETPVVRSLGLELQEQSLAQAQERGLDGDWVQRIVAAEPSRRRVLEIRRIMGGSAADEVLKEGDLLLAIDGVLVTRLSQADALMSGEQAVVTVLQEGKVLQKQVDAIQLPTGSVDRVLFWGGMLIHAPHYEVAMQTGVDPKGVYITWMWYGGPFKEGIFPTQRIVEVDGVATSSLDDFIEAVSERPDRSSLRLRTIGLDGSEHVGTLTLDLRYWPTRLFESQAGLWTRTEL